jgi:hypothetical protein
MIEWIRRRWRYRKTWGSQVGQDCISLDGALCEWLGPRLLFLAEHSLGYPCGMTQETWAETLRAHGETLLAFEGRWDCDTFEQEEALRDAARTSLHWVADTLDTLWD